MSQNYLTKSEAATKLGVSTLSGTDFATKADIAGTGAADTSKLSGYGNNDFVVDANIISIPLLNITQNRIVEIADDEGEFYLWFTGQTGQVVELESITSTLIDSNDLIIQDNFPITLGSGQTEGYFHIHWGYTNIYPTVPNTFTFIFKLNSNNQIKATIKITYTGNS